MGANDQAFAKESIGKLLFKLSVPIIVSMLVSELYNMVDTIFVGNYVDPNGIGALVVVFPIQRIIIAISMMIGIGTSTAFSRARGANDMDKARSVITNGFTLVMVVMVPLMLLVYFNAEPILYHLGASGPILDYGYEYLTVIIFGSIFLSWTIFTSNLMISMGKSSISIMSTSIGAVMNVIIDYVLVKKLSMGVQGAAIATTVSQFAGFLYAYYHLRQLKTELGVKKGFGLSKTVVYTILAVGVSAFIVEAEDGILMAVLNNLLRTHVGNQAIVVLGVISKVYMFLFVTLFGISSGMQPIAAYNVGAKNYERLGEVLKKTTIYATLTTTLLWLISLIFAPKIMPLFMSNDYVELIAESTKAFRIIIALFPLVSVYYISIFYFQALGKAKQSVVISILRQVILMVPIAVILVKHFDMGAMGVWLSYPIADAIVAIISFFLLRNESRKIKTKIAEENAQV